MRIHNMATIVFFVIIMFGCGSRPVSTDLSKVESVDSVELLSHDANSTIFLTNRLAVNKWKDYLLKINHDWVRDSWNTFPTPQYTILLKEKGVYRFAIYIGKDYAWVGIRKEEQSPVLHNLSRDDSNELRELFKEFDVDRQ